MCLYITNNCVRKNFFTRTVTQYWTKLSAGVVEPPFLKVSRPGQTKPQLTWCGSSPALSRRSYHRTSVQSSSLKVFKIGWIKAWATWSEHTADPTLTWRPHGVPSNLKYPMMLWPQEVLSNNYYFHDTVNMKSRLTSGHVNNILSTLIFQAYKEIGVAFFLETRPQHTSQGSSQELKRELETLRLGRDWRPWAETKWGSWAHGRGGGVPRWDWPGPFRP